MEELEALLSQLSGPHEVKHTILVHVSQLINEKAQRNGFENLSDDNSREGVHTITKEQHKSPLAALPDELLMHILSFLEVPEIYALRLINTRWAIVGGDPSLLQLLTQKKCGTPAKPNLPALAPDKDWKWLYTSQQIIEVETYTGLGSAILASGGRFDGEWKDGKEHGFGIKYWPILKKPTPEDEQISEGSVNPEEAKESEKQNPPPQEYDSYEGYWKDGYEHGVGRYRWADSSEYTGDWSEGKRSGEGIYVWPNGSSYVSEWKDGHQDGLGTYCWPSGSLYAGGWKNGNQNGWGLKRWGDSSQYEGEWIEGQKHGKGTYSWIDGRRYKGTWDNGKKHGYGEYLWSDGTVYEGEWENGLRHGRGVMRYRNGTTYDGMWHKDRRVEDGGKPGESKSALDKPYDLYFAEADEVWEKRYRESIDGYAAKKRQERDETRPKRLELKKQKQRLAKRFGVDLNKL